MTLPRQADGLEGGRMSPTQRAKGEGTSLLTLDEYKVMSSPTWRFLVFFS